KNGHVLAALALFDQLRELETIGARHFHVEHNRREFVLKYRKKRFVCAAGPKNRAAAGVENAFERIQIARLVIHEQNLDGFIHRFHESHPSTETERALYIQDFALSISVFSCLSASSQSSTSWPSAPPLARNSSYAR